MNKRTPGIMKRKIKDSLFTHLFGSDKGRLLELYRALHPEDDQTCEDDLGDVTIENVLCEGVYNDLGFTVGKRLVTLVEAQSAWSDNVVPRSLVYLGKTYDRLLAAQPSLLYSTRKVELLRPELWVVCPDPHAPAGPVTLGGLFLGGEGADVEARVRVVRPNGGNDILQQYLRFCQIEVEEARRCGRNPGTLEIILDRCAEEGILTEYLREHRHEVVAIMTMMYSQEEVMEDYLAIKGREAMEQGMAKGMEKGMEKGMAKGRAEGENLLARLMEALLAKGATEDATRAAADAEFRHKLYSEYGIA